MHASVSFDRDSGQVRVDSLADDKDLTEKYTGLPVHFTVPPDWAFEATHPDLLALVAILCLHPFVGERLSLNLAVSEEFRAACSASLSYECTFASNTQSVPPRSTGSVPGLSTPLPRSR